MTPAALVLSTPGKTWWWIFFFFFFLIFFLNVARVMMVFGVSLPSHKSPRRQINSSLQEKKKKIHQGAIDFINCSGEGLTGCLLHNCASGTKVEATI